ncbi:MAG TPA: S8 family serine peptidase [Paraburkholderia sp.]|jgi:subtilisin family serine protease|nr:S8 family serine peptidase [Paraburkholderia sp.]
MLRNFDPAATHANDPTPPVGSVGDAHGTAVAGIIAATANNRIGGQGVAPQATLGAVRYLCDGCDTPVNTLSTYGGAPFSQNVAVYNASYGASPASPIPFDLSTDFMSVLLQHLETMRNGLGALLVKAAGNSYALETDNVDVVCDNANAHHVTCLNANSDPVATMPQAVTTAAVNATGERSSYSSAGSNILVSGLGGEFGFAPGVPPGNPLGPALVTTDLTGCNQGYSSTQGVGRFSNPFDVPGSTVNAEFNAGCDYTASMNGTSSAAPTVSGVIALMLQANPALTWRDVRQILMRTARRIDASRVPATVELPSGEAYVPEPAWTQNAAGLWFDNWYGFGLVDAGAAVNMARQYNLRLSGPMLTNTAVVDLGEAGEQIPQANVSGLQLQLPVSGSARTVEYVQVVIDMAVADAGDLAVEVISPGGTRSVVQNAYNGFVNTGASVIDWVLATNAFNGESAQGTWTVHFIDVDTRGGDPMQVGAVGIRVMGH